MEIAEIAQTAALVIGPSGMAFVSVRWALNGMRKDIKAIKKDVKAINGGVRDLEPRVAVLEERSRRS